MTSTRKIPSGVSGEGAGLNKKTELHEEPKPRCEACGNVGTPHTFRPRPKTKAGTAGGEVESTTYICDSCFYIGCLHSAKMALGTHRITPEEVMFKAAFDTIAPDPENPEYYICGIAFGEEVLVAKPLGTILEEEDASPPSSPTLAGAVYEAFDCLLRCAAKVREQDRRPDCFHKFDTPVPSCRGCAVRLDCFGVRS